MIALLAAFFVFLAIAAVFAGVALPQLVVAGADRRVRALAPGPSGVPPDAAGPSLRRSASSIPTLRRLLDGSSWAEVTAARLARAGLPLRVGEYVLARLLVTCAAFVVPLFAGVSALTIVVGLIAAFVAFLTPPLIVRSLAQRRVAQIEKQLVEFLPSLASSLRAGFALQHGIEAAARQLGSPLSDELSAFLNDVSLGATVDGALQEMAARVSSRDLDMVVTAMLVQRTTGGSLAEVLEQAAETLRERERIQGEVRTFTAQQRLTGLILSVYPIAVGLLLLAIMPATWSKLFTDPAGQVQLAVALGLQAIGFLWIKRALRVVV